MSTVHLYEDFIKNCISVGVMTRRWLFILSLQSPHLHFIVSHSPALVHIFCILQCGN